MLTLPSTHLNIAIALFLPALAIYLRVVFGHHLPVDIQIKQEMQQSSGRKPRKETKKGTISCAETTIIMHEPVR